MTEFGFSREEIRDAVGFSSLFLFVELFGRPRLICDFDLFGKVFAAGDVLERGHLTIVMSNP